MPDRTVWLFAALNLMQASVIGAIARYVPSRSPVINGVLWGAAALMLAAAAAVVIRKPWARGVAAIACIIHGAVGLGFAALVIASASYLYGIYGGHGRALGGIALAIAAMVLIVFWLVPAHELAFLRRQGRSA
ncbi:MAG: hypothetical protein HY897_02475 [Deltaproteobacteria bacterium]|nr:hypothetical protein [Deltaproteobacteria bacterium]